MSLTFTTESLIDAAKAAIKNNEAELAEWERKREKFLIEHAAVWNEKQRPQVKALRSALTDMLKSSKPIHLADVRRAAGLHDLELPFYTPPSDHHISAAIGQKPTPNNDMLRGLIGLMEAHTGDTISANQLKLLGYDKLQWLFQAAAATPGAVVS